MGASPKNRGPINSRQTTRTVCLPDGHNDESGILSNEKPPMNLVSESNPLSLENALVDDTPALRLTGNRRLPAPKLSHSLRVTRNYDTEAVTTRVVEPGRSFVITAIR